MANNRSEPRPHEGPEAGEDRLAPLNDWLAGLADQVPAAWPQLPDIGLYMDQVMTYIDRQLALYRSSAKEHVVTSAMVNNYIKDGLLPRAELKKYAPAHLALLTMIGALKQVLSMQDLQILLNRGDGRSVPGTYEHFLERLKTGIAETAATVADDVRQMDDDERLPGLRQIALDLAIEARVRVLIAEQLLATVAAAERSASERKAAAEAGEKNSRKK